MTLRDKEVLVQLYLHSQESELGLFILKVIHAKHANRISLLEDYNGKLDKDLDGSLKVTPQEELFAGFFRDEKITVKDMSILELRSHREELAKIAFEARARLTAVDDEERERKTKAKGSGPQGFSTSLQTDELTSNAINKIKDRQKKLTKQEKLLAGLEKLGIDTKEAEKIMSAGTILARVRENEKKSGANAPKESVTNFNNPFVNPPELQAKIDVAIQEETNTVVVTKETEAPKATGFVNPFAK